jgi:hypothetical protein
MGALLLAAGLFGLSEFQRAAPDGSMLDLGPGPSTRIALRAAQGGHASFQVVVRDAASFRLSVSLPFPVDAFLEWQHTLQRDRRQFPDALIPVALPYAGGGEHVANAFWIDVWIPRDARVGPARGEAVATVDGARLALPIEIDVVAAVVPRDDAVVLDHNSYGSSWLPDLYPHATDTESILRLIHAHHRIFYEHRGVYHQLGYGHGGKVGPEFAPALEGSGRKRRVASWDLFDRHYGPLLDGSAFRDTRRGPAPIPFVYLPVNPEWPASYLWWGEPGYEAELVNVLAEMERHFRDKGWTRTRFELFFNHKKRYKAFSWDGDEVRFSGDDGFFRAYHAMFGRAIPKDSPVRFVFRADVSWTMERQFRDLAGVIDFWCAGSGMLSWYRDSARAVKRRGDILWHYGGTPEIPKPPSAITANVLKTWMWGIDGYIHWLAVSPGRDPWSSSDGGALALVYPGERFGVKGPIPSIRLKVQRNAAEDIALVNSLPRPDRHRERVASLFNQTTPDQWWTPRPPLADTAPHDWTNRDIDEVPSPHQARFDSVDPQAWHRVRSYILDEASR